MITNENVFKYIKGNKLWLSYIIFFLSTSSIFIVLYLIEFYLSILIVSIFLCFMHIKNIARTHMIQEDIEKLQFINTELSKRLMEMMR